MELGSIAYGAQIEAAARAHGLDPKLLAAVAAQETGGPGACSGRNIVGDGGHGHGLFQIDDRSWAFGSTPAAMDPAANADEAASILSSDLARYGSVRAALSAYNSGSPTASGTATTWGDGRSLGYAASVMRHYAALGGSPGQLVADAGTTSAGVNALATAAALSAPVTVAAPAAASAPAGQTGGIAAEGAALTMPQPLTPTFTPAPPMQYHTAADQAAQSVAGQGDAALGALVDASDGLEPDGDAGS